MHGMGGGDGGGARPLANFGFGDGEATGDVIGSAGLGFLRCHAPCLLDVQIKKVCIKRGSGKEHAG